MSIIRSGKCGSISQPLHDIIDLLWGPTIQFQKWRQSFDNAKPSKPTKTITAWSLTAKRPHAESHNVSWGSAQSISSVEHKWERRYARSPATKILSSLACLLAKPLTQMFNDCRHSLFLFVRKYRQSLFLKLSKKYLSSRRPLDHHMEEKYIHNFPTDVELRKMRRKKVSVKLADAIRFRKSLLHHWTTVKCRHLALSQMTQLSDVCFCSQPLTLHGFFYASMSATAI